MDTQYNHRRATLFFAGQVDFTETTLPKYIQEFSTLKLLPSINKGLGVKFTPKGIEPQEILSLDLRLLDETLKVSFGPDRVDIVSTKSDEDWITFCEETKNISNILTNKMGLKYTRLALCANISFNLNKGLGDIAYGKLTKTSDENPVEWQIRKVLRKEFKVSQDMNILTNNVFTLSRNKAVVDSQDISDKINIDFDFNTYQGISIDDINTALNDFWIKTSTLIDDGIKHYEHIFREWK